MTIAQDSAPYAIAELDPGHAEAIRATLPLVGAHIDQITPLFYAKMFAAHPELLRDRFNRGNQTQGAQQRALAASIATFAAHLVDPALPHPRELLSRIGHKHASLGVTAAEYHIVHEHLFAAIVEVLGAETVTAEVAAAWDRVYWLMATTLIDLEAKLYAEAGVAPGRSSARPGWCGASTIPPARRLSSSNPPIRRGHYRISCPDNIFRSARGCPTVRVSSGSTV